MRCQPPAYSPTGPRALLRGSLGLIGLDRASASAVREELRQRHHASDVLLTDSGTSALRLALEFGRDTGAPVAVPAFGCYDIASAVVGAGRKAVLYDLDPRTLAPDAASLEEALHSGAAAVVVAHLYGYPVDALEVRSAVDPFGAVVIEDAAQGDGGVLRGRPLGSFGCLSVLSFGRGKGVTAGGGGALLAHDETGCRALDELRVRLAAPARATAALVMLAGQWALGRPSLYWIPTAVPFLHLGETVYRAPYPPRRMARTCTAVLPQALRRTSQEMEIRRRHAGRLLMALAGSSMTAVAAAPGAEPGFLRLPVSRAGNGPPTGASARRLGIQRSYPSALCDLTPFRPWLLNADATLAGARGLAERLFTLPTHSLLREDDLSALESWIGRQ
jgi:dTDP-4-amino-4,6-dideoxygalactose transaminase